jgi:hypothetical protein
MIIIGRKLSNTSCLDHQSQHLVPIYAIGSDDYRLSLQNRGSKRVFIGPLFNNLASVAANAYRYLAIILTFDCTQQQ